MSLEILIATGLAVDVPLLAQFGRGLLPVFLDGCRM